MKAGAFDNVGCVALFEVFQKHFFVRVIKLVADYDMAMVGRMSPNLIGPPGQWLGFNQRMIFFLLD